MSLPSDDADLQALAHARHELRTPINALLGYSEMLLEDTDSHPELQAGLQEIQIRSRQLQEAVSESLQGVRLDAAPLAGVWRQAAEQLGPQAMEIGVRLQSLLRYAQDKDLADFMPDLERLHEASDLFLRLTQGDIPRAEKPAARTVPPVAPVTPVATSETLIAPAAETDWSEFRGHVLIVDDNKVNRDLLARGLLKWKHHFALAAHGKQALDMLATRAFDLVLLDILMPEMDGFETLSRIKADAALRHIPVIMISALDQIDSVVRCVEMGAEDYLPKPFDPVLLEARVGACLEKKRLRDQELEYLRNVAIVTEAAAAVEAGAFDPETLGSVSQRRDSLGQLARMFQSMAREVKAREERLKQQVHELRIEIDQSRKATQVAEITETDYFQQLQQRAAELKKRREG